MYHNKKTIIGVNTVPGKAISVHFCELGILNHTDQSPVWRDNVMSWLLAKTKLQGSNAEATIDKDAVVQLVHAPSCSSTKASCLVEVANRS